MNNTNGSMISQEEQLKIFNEYLDAAYYYFNKDIDSLRNHMNDLQDKKSNVLISTYIPSVSKDLSKVDILNLIRDFMDKYVIDIEVYFHDVLSSMTNKRFETDTDVDLVSVKNNYGDVVYYNKDRLDYLYSKYGKIKDKDVKNNCKKAKKDADAKRSIFLRIGDVVAPNYSLCDHLRYKYYLNKFASDYNLKDEYKELSSRNSTSKVSFISYIEFVEYKVSSEMRRNNYQRSR